MNSTWAGRLGTDDGRSWWEVIGAHVFLSDVDLQQDLKQLMGQGNPSIHWLSGLLHEGMHHWCYDSPLGGAIALLHARARQRVLRAIKRPLTEDERWDILDDLARARAAEILLAPLAEGLALFMEFDVRPGKSDNLSVVLSTVLAFFTDIRSLSSLSPPEIAARINRDLTNLLLQNRLWDKTVERKMNLLSHPLTCRSGGYLAGYLLVKHLQGVAMSRSTKLIDPDLFATYLRSFIYDDYGLVSVLLDPSLKDVSAVNAFYVSLQERWLAFLRSDLDADANRFSEKYSDATMLNGLGQEKILLLSRKPEEAEVGAARFEQLAEEVSEGTPTESDDGLGVDFFQRVLQQREFIRLAVLPAHVYVGEHGRVTAARRKDGESTSGQPRIPWEDWWPIYHGRIVVNGPAVEGTAPEMGDGRVEFYVSGRRIHRFVIVTLGEKVVGQMFTTEAPEDFRDDVQDWLPSVIFELAEQGLGDLFKAEFGKDVHQMVFDEILNGLEEARDEVYIPRALSRVSDQNFEACKKMMAETGVAGLLDNDEHLLESLAHLSLATPMGLTREQLADFQKLSNWEFLDQVAVWQECERRTGFPLVLANDEMVWSRV